MTDEDVLAALDPTPAHPDTQRWTHLAAADEVERWSAQVRGAWMIAEKERLLGDPTPVLTDRQLDEAVATIVSVDAGLASILAERMFELRLARRAWEEALADDLGLLLETLQIEVLVGGGRASEWHWCLSSDPAPEGWARIGEGPTAPGRIALDVIVREDQVARSRAAAQLTSVVVSDGGELGLQPWGTLTHPGAVQGAVRRAAAILDATADL
ncbi:hypothetical protein [Sanguibacter sp. Leaf3]|uniref:hypothetical protein n=1 Tax=Sanguibacter sp. Leaf3 TaxID=1736209 RepID=UPI0006FDFC91|nr:hypothetical protein [Sanguibacter sp. Leaf3]KQT98396.1 hypothetical protein ASG53_12100 [Sanguibacter sp. Leaf3]